MSNNSAGARPVGPLRGAGRSERRAQPAANQCDSAPGRSRPSISPAKNRELSLSYRRVWAVASRDVSLTTQATIIGDDVRTVDATADGEKLLVAPDDLE